MPSHIKNPRSLWQDRQEGGRTVSMVGAAHDLLSG